MDTHEYGACIDYDGEMKNFRTHGRKPWWDHIATTSHGSSIEIV